MEGERMNTKSSHKYLLGLVLVLLLSVSCSSKPIVIAVLGNYSSDDLNLSHANKGLFALYLAQEMHDDLDQYELQAVDTAQFETSEALLEELDRLGATCVIGPFLTSELNKHYEVLKTAKYPIFVVSATSDLMTDHADNFYRLMNATQVQSDVYANILVHQDHDALVIYRDFINAPYATAVANQIGNILESAGMDIWTYTYGNEANPYELPDLDKLTSDQAVLVISSGAKSGIGVQHIRESGFGGPIYLVGWAYSSELLRYIGPTTKDVYILHNSYFENKDQFDIFADRYLNTYDTEATSASSFSYESLVLIDKIYQTQKGLSLKDVDAFFVANPIYKGAFNTFKLSPSGDSAHPMVFLRIENGTYEEVGVYEKK